MPRVFFKDIPQINDKLKMLNEVGLDYLTLGQSATTLSGGEAQRIKLSKELSKYGHTKTLYLLDEPTTGLHYDDVRKLLDVLQRLASQGNTVMVIEHNLDVIKNADWVIDLGPEGGDKGGQVIAAGTPEEVARKAVTRIARRDHGRKILNERIVGPRVAGEISADKPAEGAPLPKLMQKGLLPEAATSSTSGIGGSAGIFGPLDMMCGWPLVNTTTWPASSGIALNRPVVTTRGGQNGTVESPSYQSGGRSVCLTAGRGLPSWIRFQSSQALHNAADRRPGNRTRQIRNPQPHCAFESPDPSTYL